MANSDGSVEVRITGSVDAAVATTAHAATAAGSDIATSTTRLTASQKAMAEQVLAGAVTLKDLAKTLGSSAQAAATLAAVSKAVAAAKTAESEAVAVNTVVQQANTAATINSRVGYEGLVLVHEALMGRYTRMVPSAMILGQAMAGQSVVAGALAAALSPVGLAVIAVTAAMVGAVAATAIYEAEQKKLLVSTVGLGAASGVSADQINALSTKNLTLKSSVSDNQKALEAYTGAGVRNTDTLQQLSATTSDFADITGQKTKDAVKELAEAMKDPAKGAEKLNEQLSFLDSTELQQIETLSNLGEKTKAQTELVSDLKDRDDRATDASGQLEGGFHRLGVAASDVVTFLGSVNEKLNEFNILAVGGQGAVDALKGRIAQVQRTAQQKQDSAAGLKAEQDTPEGRAQAERERLQGSANTISRALQADIQLHGEHSDAVTRDRQALAEYTRALSTYLTPVQKKLAVDALDVKIAGAKHAHNQQLVDDLTRQKALIGQSGVVESDADAQALAKGAGDVAGARTHTPKGPKGPTDVSKWTEQLHAQEVASNDFFKDQTDQELAFWQSKLGLTKQGSKEWLEVQSKIYDAQKKLAHDAYDDHLATLNTQLEADRGNWTKEQANWTAKLAYIKDHFGAEGKEYQTAYKEYEAAERQHQQTLAQIQKDADAERISELKTSFQTAKTLRDADAHTAEANIQQQGAYSPLGAVTAAQQILALHKQMNQQDIADLQATYAAEDGLRQQDIARAQAVYGKDSQQYASAQNAKKAADAQFYGQHQVLENKMVNQTVQDQLRIQAGWHKMIDPLVSAWGSAVQGLVKGTETWNQALLSIADSMLSVVVNAIEGMVEKWIVNLILGKAVQATTAQGQVASLAAVAGAGGVASMAGAPFPLDLTAPAFGASMAANALAYSALASFDVGTNYVPQDMVAQIHEGERIIPKADNAALMQAVGGAPGASRGGFGDGPGRGGGDTFHTTVQGLDSRDIARMMDNPKVVRAAMQAFARHV